MAIAWLVRQIPTNYQPAYEKNWRLGTIIGRRRWFKIWTVVAAANILQCMIIYFVVSTISAKSLLGLDNGNKQ